MRMLYGSATGSRPVHIAGPRHEEQGAQQGQCMYGYAIPQVACLTSGPLLALLPAPAANLNQGSAAGVW
jgi:hypothetical protein